MSVSTRLIRQQFHVNVFLPTKAAEVNGHRNMYMMWSLVVWAVL